MTWVNNEALNSTRKIEAATGGLGATYTGGAFLFGVNVSLATGSEFALCLETDSQPIVLDSPIINSNSGDLSFTIYEGSEFTGGSNVPVYLNDRTSTLTPVVQSLVLDPTITSFGLQITPTVQAIGDNSQGAANDFLVGYPLIFKANTKYILRVLHNDGQTRQVNLYSAGYRRRD